MTLARRFADAEIKRVVDGLVQEIDIRTGRVLFQWDSAAHVPYADSYVPRPSSPSTPWDWFHINAVHLDTDGNLLVDSRNTWTTFKVNRHTGQIIGWGGLPYISEFSPSGKLLFNAKLPAGVSTYRAYLLPWHPAS